MFVFLRSVKVLGYVATGYGHASENEVKHHIDVYKVRRRTRNLDCRFFTHVWIWRE